MGGIGLDLRVWKRDFTDPLGFPDVQFKPQRYSWHSIGGPERATVTAYGNGQALWKLLEWLRAPVEMVDWRGEAVWWGFVDEVTVRVGGVEVGVALKGMFNRVAVAYSYVEPGSATVGTRATTSWVQDDDCVAEYGALELLSSLSGATAAHAEAARDTILAAYRYPIPVVKVQPGRGGLSATLRCRGWWDTLAWQYYAQAAGIESYTGGTAVNLVVGDDAARQQVAQGVSLATDTSWTTHAIHLNVRKEGSPTDALVFELRADAAGVPGSVLDSAQISGGDLSDSVSWVGLVLSETVDVSYGTDYWIVVRRTGSVDATNHYVVRVSEDLGYARGALRIWNGSSWVARSPDADMLFKLTGVWETTRQIEEVVEAEGAFFSGIEVMDVSGVHSSPYRDGDNTALSTVLELLKSGTSSGQRLLTRVSRERVLEVYEEPEYDEGAVKLFVEADGRPVDRWGNRMLAHTCPVARWCGLKDVVPATLDMALMADPGHFFVERAEFDVGKLLWTPEGRGVLSPWEVTRLVEG